MLASSDFIKAREASYRKQAKLAREAELERRLELAKELEYLQKLSENEQLKFRVKRIVTRLNDETITADARYRANLPCMLGYLSTEQFCEDARALWLYVGATLALDLEEPKKKKPRRKRTEAAPDGAAPRGADGSEP